MGKVWLLTWRSLLLSLLLHAVITGVVFFSFDFAVAPPPKLRVGIVNAVSVDKQQVEKELKRLADQEQAKRQKEIDRQSALEKKAVEVERKVKEEQKKLARIKKQKQEAEKKRKQEEKKQKELKKKRQLEQERRKKAAAEKKRLEEQKRRQEEARKKKEAEQKKREEERKRQEEEAKRLAAEKALQEQLEAEQQALQERQDSTKLRQYELRIGRAVESSFNKLGLEFGLSCVILIRLLEGGTVADVSITQSSGNGLFDKRAEDAVYKASPLPVPDEARLFNRMRTIEFLFKPKPRN